MAGLVPNPLYVALRDTLRTAEPMWFRDVNLIGKRWDDLLSRVNTNFMQAFVEYN
ncbi:hypothetical protein ACQPZZ_22820 [Microbispora sp. CA-135349]|uniref:hypothetical protein n=1 Tax=Microbispora sp. CA-135349 TaxID=3239953 RepID=UPI003D8CB173